MTTSPAPSSPVSAPSPQGFLRATGALLASQVGTSALALVSLLVAFGSVDRQRALADARVEAAALGSAVREQYVHQAHTYIEGDGHHLHHGADSAAAVRAGLDRLDVDALSAADRADLATVRARQASLEAFFDEQVAPLARTGGLDRARASELHGRSEALTSEATHAVDALLVRLGDEEAVERSRASWATVVAVLAALAAAGLGTAVAIAFDRLARRLGEAEAQRIESARLVALGEMSAAVAHELMNPVAAIVAAVPGLEGPDVAAVRAEAEHARAIVTGLLGFARPSEQAPARVDVAAAARDAVDRAAFAADAREIRVAWAGAGASVPATSAPETTAVITASPAGVRQILDNLIGNAIDASSPGSSVEVEILTGPLRVEVRDRGAGIPAAVRARLYEPFVTGKARGTGLGLAVCQRIAKACGTGLTHTDRPGGGTVATWTLEAGHG